MRLYVIIKSLCYNRQVRCIKDVWMISVHWMILYLITSTQQKLNLIHKNVTKMPLLICLWTIPVLFNEKYCLPRHSTNRLFQEKEVYFELFWQFYDTLKKVYLQIASQSQGRINALHQGRMKWRNCRLTTKTTNFVWPLWLSAGSLIPINAIFILYENSPNLTCYVT